MQKLGVFAIIAALSLASLDASATISTQGVATAFRLQNYNGTSTVIWGTGSVCTYGKLTLDPNESADRNKLLWATVLAAKAMGAKMIFSYDTANDNCFIRDFAID